MDDATFAPKQCPGCGRTLPADAPDGLCPSCLLQQAFATVSNASDDSETIDSAPSAGSDGDDDPRLAPGTVWGGYRIGRLLGRGGMGEVYEAEQLSSGRRVAVKILRGRLRNEADRARFLREGQLAASVSHPHTVYIYGSEEIGGTPVIVMELLPGGTLKDRVAANGPMPVGDAVSAILDVIGGLDAAQAGGILHRDIKPSNCFTDLEGAVKVGDFGLSISTLARDVRHQLEAGGFQGTPQFAPPEQLRGEPLDVRADIYAVGATLYYLLTGQPPFDARDLRELFDRASSEPPRSPRALRPDIPAALAAVVLQCLSKRAADRLPTYAALADALRPFTRQEVRAAHPVVRLLAYIVDAFAINSVVGVVRLAAMNVLPQNGSRDNPWLFLVDLVYFLVLEAVWGASLGKWLFRLRVASADGSGGRARVADVATRTGIFFTPQIVGAIFVTVAGPVIWRWGVNPGSGVTLDVGRTIPLVLTIALFATARRGNGWSGLHERLSGTRAVARRAGEARRSAAAESPMAAPLLPGGEAVGPFRLVREMGATGAGTLALAFDPILRRGVWIHFVAPGADPVSPARRDASRMGRLHWLTGRRGAAADEGGHANWDAYESPDGDALLRASEHVGWGVLKLWLLDLAREMMLAVRDGSLPALALDRLWLKTNGHLVLLDFRAPGLAPQPESGPVALLAAVANRALSGDTSRAAGPLPRIPLSARLLVDRWSTTPRSIDEEYAALAEAVVVPDRVARSRRAVPIVLAAAPPLFFALIGALVLPVLGRILTPDNGALMSWLDALREPAAGSRFVDPALRATGEIYVAGRFAERLRDDRFWGPLASGNEQLKAERAFADALVERHPSVSADELQMASAALGPEIEDIERRAGRGADFSRVRSIVIGTLAALAVGWVAIAALVSSAAVPGGIVTRLIGHAVVGAEGREIGRMRSTVRGVVAWSPAIVWMAILALSPRIQVFVPVPAHPILIGTIVAGVTIAGAIWTILRPERGPHDWIAGTWVVPR
jgi:hypothetical protein